jgi:hypothetical protein
MDKMTITMIISISVKPFCDFKCMFFPQINLNAITLVGAALPAYRQAGVAAHIRSPQRGSPTENL